MAIVYKLDEHGGFTAGDTETRVTSYAYPTSTYATQARRAPEMVANEMVRMETRHGFAHEIEYDARHWVVLLASVS